MINLNILKQKKIETKFFSCFWFIVNLYLDKHVILLYKFWEYLVMCTRILEKYWIRIAEFLGKSR